MSEVPYSFAVVMPIYEDQEASTRLFRELYAEYGDSVYVVAVDDGSVRQPVSIHALEQCGLAGVVITLKRNVGHQRAIAIGINYVAEHLSNIEHTIVMDSDGEDTPASIRTLMAPLASPQVDVVVAERKSRVETLRFRTFYLVYKFLFALLTGRKISFGNFMALKPNAVRRLAVMPEIWTHVASMTVMAGLIAIFLKLAGFATPGWFSVAMGILFLTFLQTGALTLMTLMLTGVVRGGAATHIDYRVYVAVINHAQPR